MTHPRFVVVIPSYNNEIFCEKNLFSVLSQDYLFFRVVFIDDASTDNTLQKVKSLIKKMAPKQSVEIIHNEINQGVLENIYNTAMKAEDGEIIVNVDGDDWLKHEGVLSFLAKVYKKGHIWLTYGQYENYPSGTIGQCSEISSKVHRLERLRELPWVTSHLRTFYAGLFKKIRKEDLLYEGEFFRLAGDLAFMFPMIEMAGEKRVKFISEILYVYNAINPLGDGKTHYEMQQEMGRVIRSKRPYELLG
jgi:glycosyltransferase involved in cell wall biosynthesis